VAERQADEAPLAGLVLAGGRSARLGRDKAAIRIGGETLLGHAVALVAGIAAEVRVAVRPEQLDDTLRARFATLADEAALPGPAAGILAAHRLRPGSAWLVLACDMPNVTRAMLAALVAARTRTRAGVAFRGVDGAPEPLCAIYEPATLARFRRQVDAGGSASPRDCLAAAGCLLLEAPDPRALASINTPRDLESLAGTGPS
jgi:molybdopterin-guanine dinucleotide biosynthesis protein A